MFQLLKRYEQTWPRISAPERLREVALPEAATTANTATQKLEAAA